MDAKLGNLEHDVKVVAQYLRGITGFDLDHSDAALIGWVRDNTRPMEIPPTVPERVWVSLQNVRRAPAHWVTQALFGYETYILATGSEGASNAIQGSPDALTEWEFPLLYPSGCPVSGDHLAKWHHGITGSTVTGRYKTNTLWAGLAHIN